MKIMRAKFSHVPYYSTIDNFFSDLHDVLSEDQNRGYPLIYRGPFNPPAER